MAEVAIYTAETFLDSLAKDRPLAPATLAQIYPYSLRVIPYNGSQTPDAFHFTPQSGELYRYGVFFWACDTLPSLTADQHHLSILMETKKLLGIIDQTNPDLMAKGIMVSPSLMHDITCREVETELRRRNQSFNPASRIGDGCAVYERIQKEWISLDLSAVKKGTRPILSIPTELTIPTSLLHYKDTAR